MTKAEIHFQVNKGTGSGLKRTTHNEHTMKPKTAIVITTKHIASEIYFKM
jgi:hypothetical protein